MFICMYICKCVMCVYSICIHLHIRAGLRTDEIYIERDIYKFMKFIRFVIYGVFWILIYNKHVVL